MEKVYEVEGCEYLKNGKYKIYVDIGYDDRGIRRRRTKTVTPTSERNLKKLKRDFEIQCEKEKEQPINNITFGDFVERWKKTHVSHLKYNTRRSYDIVLESNTLDHFKKMKLKDIKRIHIIEFLNKQEKMKSAKLRLLKAIFSKAVEWEIIDKNPAQNVKLTGSKKKDVVFYTEEELAHLFKILENTNERDRMIVKLAAIGGLRRSEILGIVEENIDFDNNSIYVERQLIYDIPEKYFYLDSLKNSTPRMVHFPAEFMKELKSYYIKFKEKRMALGNLWEGIYNEDEEMINLIFTTSTGKPLHPNTVWTMWNKIVTRNNLKKIAFHDLRHSCASLMVKKGINFKVIQERLGHLTIGITLDLYSHLDDDQHRESVDAFKGIL